MRGSGTIPAVYVSLQGGRGEIAQQMAAHESPRTTALYDRRDDEVAVDEVERILI
jgi:hypothetical protein